MNTAQALRFRSSYTLGTSRDPIAASGQVSSDIEGPSFPGHLGINEWNALTSIQKVDFLVQNATDRQQLADALTHGLEHGYNDIGSSVGLAESIFNRAVAASGQIAAPLAVVAPTCSGCGCGMGGCGCGRAPRVVAVVPSGQASTVVPASATTPPAAPPASSGVRPVVFVAATAAAILGVYMFRRAQHKQFRDNPELPYGNPPPYGL